MNAAVRLDLSDPCARRTVEGLLSLCGIDPRSGNGADEDGGLLLVTDGASLPAFDEGIRVRCTVLLVPAGDPGRGKERGKTRAAADPDEMRARTEGPVFLLGTPILLEEGAEVFAEVRAVLGSAGEGEGRSSASSASAERQGPGADPPDADAREGFSGPDPASAVSGPEEPEVPEDRTGEIPTAESVVCVSPDGRTVSWRGRTARLTVREAAYFLALYERRGRAVSREELLAASGAGTASNLTDVYMGYLRRKLRPVFGEGAVLSVRGRGYLLNLPGPPDSPPIIP